VNGRRVEPERVILLASEHGPATAATFQSSLDFFVAEHRLRGTLRGLHVRIRQTTNPGTGNGSGDVFDVSQRHPFVDPGMTPFRYESFLRPMSDDEQRDFLKARKASRHPEAEA
jgi:hypothetical protein